MSISHLQPGDRMPFWYGIGMDGRFFSLESVCGAPAVIVLTHGVPADALPALLDAFMPWSDSFANRGAALLFLGDAALLAGRREAPPGDAAQPHVIDCNPALLGLPGRAPRAATMLVIDRNQRVALHAPAAPGEDEIRQALRCLDSLPREQAQDVVLPAPVLLLPNLLCPALCRELIDRFERGPTIDSGLATMDEAGRPRTRTDHGKKRRRDLLISPDDARHTILQELLLRRCRPEIARSFQADITRTDRILVACYDASGGWFKRHRDNAAEHVAFREFALSVNLNADAYEGGHLHFPECNDHRYRPPTGAGFIFSTSLLHEATAVTSGRRYVLLTFFHGEAAEQRRLAFLGRTQQVECATQAGSAG